MIFIGDYREFNSEGDFPSMKDFFEESPYENKDKIIMFLKNKGMVKVTSPEIDRDVFTNEIIGTDSVGRVYDDFFWDSVLAYYVDKYNLRLPKEFEEMILKAS